MRSTFCTKPIWDIKTYHDLRDTVGYGTISCTNRWYIHDIYTMYTRCIHRFTGWCIVAVKLRHLFSVLRTVSFYSHPPFSTAIEIRGVKRWVYNIKCIIFSVYCIVYTIHWMYTATVLIKCTLNTFYVMFAIYTLIP